MDTLTTQPHIRRLADTFFDELVAIRRHLHQYPELSFQEKETGAFVAQRLSEWGITFRDQVAGYGIVAQIGDPAGPVLALRADMDALPILEQNKVTYCSRNEGVMHACGHDVHTASLLGAARILKEVEAELPGMVRLFFQPAEEKLPGGASLMIREGVLREMPPDVIFGQHVHPPLQVGKVGFRAGRYMASADELYITVKGRGGHGALPHDCLDPISMTAQLITSLQQIVSRYGDPTIPSVLTIGKINSEGGATNIIPNAVHLEGTFRTMDEPWREEAHRRMQKMAEGLITGMGGACDFRIVKGYPCLLNNEDLTRRSMGWAGEYLGSENVVELPPRMTAEDFAWFSQEVPGCFYRLGTGNPEKGITSPVHTDTFDVDEDCLRTGAGLMAWLALQQLAA